MILGSKSAQSVQRQNDTEIASAAGLLWASFRRLKGASPSRRFLAGKLAAALEQPVGNFSKPAKPQLTRSSERLFTLAERPTYERLSHSFGGSKLTAL